VCLSLSACRLTGGSLSCARPFPCSCIWASRRQNSGALGPPLQPLNRGRSFEAGGTPKFRSPASHKWSRKIFVVFQTPLGSCQLLLKQSSRRSSRPSLCFGVPLQCLPVFAGPWHRRRRCYCRHGVFEPKGFMLLVNRRKASFFSASLGLRSG